MNKKQLLFCFLYLITTLLQGQDVQQNYLDSLAGKFVGEIRKQGRPKVLLAADKSIFKAGETIWFRSFLINSVSQKIIHHNSYLFVDLVNDKDSVISYVLFDALNPQLNGSITLSPDLPAGYYWLRSYTRQMAESDTINVFVKPLYVIGNKINSLPARNRSTNSVGSHPIINYYPEGGSIITGANSTVGFIIKDQQGKPIETNGYIKDTRDSVVALFASNKAGQGKFTLFSSSYRRYKAYVNWNGNQVAYPLPSFNFFAGQLSVIKQDGGNKVLRVLLEDSIYTKNVATYILGISKDSLCYAAIGHGQYEVVVPEQRLPGGIVTFYLFNDQGKLLSERSVYVKESNVIVKTTTDKKDYFQREKVTLNISVSDAKQLPLPSVLSVSVSDTAFTRGEHYNTNLSHPGSFDNYTLARLNLSDEDAELVMLLKDNTYLGRTISAFKPLASFNDSLLFIKGQALDEKDKPVANKILTLFSNSGNTNFLIDTTDNAGHFSFPVYHYADSTQFALEARSLNSSTTDIKIIRQPHSIPKFSTPISLKHYFDFEPVFSRKYRNAYLDTPIISSGKEWLKRVIVTGKRKKEIDYNESYRVSSTSTIISGDQLDERRNVGDILLNVGGLHMLSGFLVINGLTAMAKPNAASEPLLLIDGVQAPVVGGLDLSPVMSTLNSINPKDIDFIEVLKGADGSNYGVRGGNGVILVNMAHDRRLLTSTNGNNFQTFYAKGISKPSLFPRINYENKDAKFSQYFDNRSTLFWNGNILTGAEPTISLNFFTTDVQTTYKVSVTGISVHGDLIYQTIVFNNK